MTKRLAPLLLWSVLGAVLLVTAYLLVNTTFMFYDDEGYVLSTLRAFLAGHRLYDEVFTQYGPWPYVYHQILTAITGSPLTHMFGRGLTAVHWVGCALACGVIAQQLTGRVRTAVAAAIIAFGLLWQMSSEPSHPGSMISLLVALAGVLVVRWPATRRPVHIGLGLGLLGAALFLTKINVGLLLVTGLGAIALRFTAWPQKYERPAAALAVAGLAVVAWALMLQKLGDDWPRTFALQFTLAAAALVWVTPAAWVERRLRLATWVGAAVGFGAGVALVSLAVLLQGTTLHALFDAVVISPVKHPAKFMFGFSWLPIVWPVSAGCWLLAAWAGWELRRRGGLSPVTRYLVAAARIAALAVFVQHAVDWLTIHGVGRFIVFCLPLAPIFTLPLAPVTAGRAPASFFPRALLALVALPQVLHAFPVAGSQMGWGTFLLVPLFVAGLDEAIEVVTAPMAGWSRSLAYGFWGLVLGINTWQLWLLLDQGWERYTTSRPLDLPGAEDIRMQAQSRETLRILTLNAAVHSDVLFSRPGMFSYNLWSGARTPTERNATHWFWLLTPEEQRAIIAELEKTPRRAIITNSRLDQFMDDIRIPMEGPLQSHLLAGYRTLFEHRDFAFLVPRDSKAVPFGLIEHLHEETAHADGTRGMVMRANIILDGEPARVALERLNQPWTALQEFRGEGTRVLLEPITTAGATVGGPIPVPAPKALRGLFRLTVVSDHDPVIPQPGETGLLVRDAAGNVLAEAVF